VDFFFFIFSRYFGHKTTAGKTAEEKKIAETTLLMLELHCDDERDEIWLCSTREASFFFALSLQFAKTPTTRALNAKRKCAIREICKRRAAAG
jgi:hypothetical protein